MYLAIGSSGETSPSSTSVNAAATVMRFARRNAAWCFVFPVTVALDETAMTINNATIPLTPGQHVGCLDSDTHDACKKTYHRVWPSLRRFLQVLEARRLNFVDLLPNEIKTHHVATNFLQ